MRGDGRIFLRGATYWCSFYLRGVEYRKSTGKTDEKAALKVLQGEIRKVHADLEGGPTFETPKARRLTVHGLLEAVKADFTLRGKASPQNLSVIKRADSDLGTYRASGLTAEQIDKYIEGRLANGDKPATVNRTTQMLGQAYVLAIRNKTLSRAPFVRHLSEAGNARQGFVAPVQFRRLLAALPNDGLRDFCEWGYITGMRKGEVASLAWSDIDGDVLTLRGEHSKNGEARAIPLTGELAKIIERRKAVRRLEENGTMRMVEFIFHRDGEPIGEFRKSWAKACVATGLGRMVCPKCGAEGTDTTCKACEVGTVYHGRIFHDLRRSAVKNLTAAGVQQVVAMRISGHKTASMFQRYNIVCTDDLRAALEKTQEYRKTEAAKQKVVGMR